MTGLHSNKSHVKIPLSLDYFLYELLYQILILFLMKITHLNSKNICSGYNSVINLTEIDPYTRSIFKELQDQRFSKGMDYYICVVKQNGRSYLFDASRFMEDCYRNQPVNPITKQAVEDFEVYVSSPDSPDFQLYMKKEEIFSPPNHLPVHWNDPSVEKTDRLAFMVEYAGHLESRNLEKALEIYQKAAKAGSTNAKLRLAQLYFDRGDQESAIKWLGECLDAQDISTSNVFFCGRLLGKCDAHALAFKAYVISARRGNLFGLGGVIRHLEAGVGVEKSLAKAREWRQELPANWRNASITDLFVHLKEIQYSYDAQGYPSQSEEGGLTSWVVSLIKGFVGL